ncbi:hypothetical protein AAP_04821 [Ascosphaera apis ARSEF 7405]|uniref:CBF1-interacting co-repressor CIR N-terminal domain-containing protein n=1 Tax=Ascosphaera apis ARSEF 7405 TaxID=392613 RepID=A0A162I527_9EURO|nr:hypothetical protein AAP_04821 [Ascosphaera apis ARSEF 7405]
MVLHLLGKKSWNVYNQDNIARVRRDEAEAAEREREKAQRGRQRDAERRMVVLRGQEPGPALDEEDVEVEQKEGERRREDRGGAGRVDRIKRRRIAGEDDTDRDIRVAREIAGLDGVAGGGDREREFKVRSAGAGADAALLDAQGHTILFPIDEKKKPQTESKDITIKPDQKRLYDEKDAWYASSIGDISSRDIPLNKDVWGNEDPRRQERSQRRMASADPLMAIKRGVGQLRETERARKKIEEERRRELEALKREQDDEGWGEE